MAETVEFDLIHEYSIYKDGITVETILKYGDRIVILKQKLTQVRPIAFLNAAEARL